MKLAIISDTHGIFRPDWTTHITDCDYLIHAGDINSRACYEKLKAIGVPLLAVRGNCDLGSWAQFLPEVLQIRLGGKMFYIVHNKFDLPFDLTDADFVIFGHTHQFETSERYGKIFLNPGSAGQPRGEHAGMAILTLHEDTHEIRHISL